MTASFPSLAKVEHLNIRFQQAKSTILEAGDLANNYFKKLKSLTVKSKGSHDLVSEADLKTELLIKDSFAKHFPDDAFFGEETGASALDGAHGIWVVDPIDGTQPFLNGLPNWCISIAYVFDGVVEFGLIYNPPVNELFVGGKNFDATVNGAPIEASSATDFSTGLVSIGFSPRSPHEFLFGSLSRLLEKKGMFYRSGSGALALVYVAAGRLLGHIEPHMWSWDCLAAIAIIEAAGGRVNPFLVGDALMKGNRVVAGAPELFADLEYLLGD